jgi:hypothetical protein
MQLEMHTLTCADAIGACMRTLFRASLEWSAVAPCVPTMGAPSPTFGYHMQRNPAHLLLQLRHFVGLLLRPLPPHRRLLGRGVRRLCRLLDRRPRRGLDLLRGRAVARLGGLGQGLLQLGGALLLLLKHQVEGAILLGQLYHLARARSQAQVSVAGVGARIDRVVQARARRGLRLGWHDRTSRPGRPVALRTRQAFRFVLRGA